MKGYRWTKQKKRRPYICRFRYIMISYNNQLQQSLTAQVLGQFIDNRRGVGPNPVQAWIFRVLWFSFTTLNFQSLHCIIRILLEAHETEIISVQGYGREKKTEIQNLKLRKNCCVL